ncbi:CHAT domain-containing protein [Streptomyces antibioticus]|uniref:CHAT domain-containing protein n=1 Tax=Streptomyces antibioticus TaxID=1890 RepID=UPI002252D933|nr:CHAT domain-containing protein [Streptomyces antibioticus]MCX5172909.1 CHAT domain-containing protein [Streptomyces antibioticus]
MAENGTGPEPEADTERRRELLAAVEERIRRWERDGDRTALSVDGYVEAGRLVASVGASLRGDHEVRRAAGLFFWYRHTAARLTRRGQSREAALGLLETVWLDAPERLPPEVRARLSDAYRPQGGPLQWQRRAAVLVDRYERTGDVDALWAAALLLRHVCEALPLRHPQRPEYFSHAARQLERLHDRTGEVTLGAALHWRRAAVAAAPDGDPRRAPVLRELARTLHDLAKDTDDLQVAEESLTTARAAVALLPEGAELRPLALHVLGAALTLRHRLRADPALLAEALAVSRDVARQTSEELPDATALRNLLVVLLHDGPDETARRRERADVLRRFLDVAGPRERAEALLDFARALTTDAAERPTAEVRREALDVVGRAWEERAVGTEAETHCRRLLRALCRTPDDTEDLLRRQVTLCRAVLDGTEPGDPDELDLRTALYNGLHRLFLLTGSAEALDDLAHLPRTFLPTPSEQGPERAAGLWRFVQAAMGVAQYSDDRALMSEAIAAGREAATLTPADAPGHLDGQADRASLVLLAHQRHGEAEALAEVVADLRRLTRAPRAHDAGYTRCLARLAECLRVRAETSDAPDAPREAADVLRVGLAVPSVSTPELLRANLAPVLRDWYERTGRIALLEEAVAVGRAAVDAHGEPDHDSSATFSTLGLALHDTFLVTRDAAVLEEAVGYARSAAAATSEHDWHRSLVLTNLALLLNTRFLVTGDRDTLEEAVIAARSSVREEVRHVDVHAWSNLCMVLTRLHQATDAPEALAEADEAGHRALATQDSPQATTWNNLAIVVRARFDTSGDVAFLRQAARYLRNAVDRTAPGHVDRPVYLTNLSGTLSLLHEATGDLGPLEESVAAARQAIEDSPRGDHWSADHLSAYTRAALRFHQRTGDPGALREAVESGGQALALTSEGHILRPQILNELGLALQEVAARDDDPEAHDAGAALLRAAAATGSPTLRHLALGNLALGHIERYERTGDAARLDDAERHVAEAALLTTGDAVDRFTLLALQGRVRWQRYLRGQDPAVLDEALAALRAAVGVRAGEVSRRLETAWYWGVCAHEAGRLDEAREAFDRAMELLVGVVPWTLDREDREHRLGRLTGLASAAAAAALDAGLPERAVELLEQSRGVLMAESVDARGDLARLRRSRPGLAEAFDAWGERARALDNLAAAPDSFVRLASTVGGPRDEADDRRRRTAERRLSLAAERDALLGKIRALPGFERFLLPPTWAELSGQAAEGPVVYVNATRGRCDALAVTRTGLCAIPLPGLEWKAIEREANRLLDATLAEAQPAEPLREILGWLWDTVTGPVLDALEAGGHLPAGPEGGPPRLWWCPTGPMVWFPLHAAGHRPGAVMDRVVSSYTPTLRALASARLARREAGADGPRRTLVVAMPDTPLASALPGVRREADRLRALVPDARFLESPDTVRDTVLGALPGHRIAHFACHAVSDWGSPRHSRLLLDDHETRPLTLGAVSQLRLRGDLAFLSACSTAGAAPDRVDEVLQLTSSFLLAGYAQVVGTLWPVQDATAAALTDAFYTDLTDDGTGPPQVGRSARALHRAVLARRDARPDNPWLWAAHVHVGV